MWIIIPDRNYAFTSCNSQKNLINLGFKKVKRKLKYMYN